MVDSQHLKRELTETGIFTVTAFLTMIVIPVLGLFAFGAVDEQEFFSKSVFYFATGIASVFVLTFGLNIMTIFFPKSAWRAILHNPEIGLFPKSLQKYLTMFDVFSVSFILFLIIGFFSVQTNTFFVAAPGTTQFQITETGRTILGTEPAATSETYLGVAILSIIMTLGVYLTRKYGVGEVESKYLIAFVLIIIGTLFWVGLHLARYSGSDVDLVNVVFFGAGGSFLTVLTGSIIPWLLWHQLNNLFYMLFIITSKDAILIGTAITLILYMAFYIWRIIQRNKKGVVVESPV